MKIIKVVCDANVANAPGRYENFTGDIDWEGTKGKVRGVNLEIFPGRTEIWIGTWLDGVWNGTEIHRSVWKNGTFKKGTFSDGKWMNGTFEGGTFDDSIWYNGTWKDGYFSWGTWKNGTWKNGTFRGKTWENGTFEGGIWDGVKWKDGNWKGGTWKGKTWEGGKINGKQSLMPPGMTTEQFDAEKKFKEILKQVSKGYSSFGYGFKLREDFQTFVGIDIKLYGEEIICEGTVYGDNRDERLRGQKIPLPKGVFEIQSSNVVSEIKEWLRQAQLALVKLIRSKGLSVPGEITIFKL